MEMTYYAPNEEEQKLLVLHTRQICNMLSKIPTLRVVTLTASLCFDFVGDVSGGDENGMILSCSNTESLLLWSP